MSAPQTHDTEPTDLPVTRLEVLDAVDAAFDRAPVDTDDLIEAALRAGARPAVLELLRRLPSRQFVRPHELWETLPEVPLGD